jgi:hypothetical protein
MMLIDNHNVASETDDDDAAADQQMTTGDQLTSSTSSGMRPRFFDSTNLRRISTTLSNLSPAAAARSSSVVTRRRWRGGACTWNHIFEARYNPPGCLCLGTGWTVPLCGCPQRPAKARPRSPERGRAKVGKSSTGRVTSCTIGGRYAGRPRSAHVLPTGRIRHVHSFSGGGSYRPADL